jgi:hypothetical protein
MAVRVFFDNQEVHPNDVISWQMAHQNLSFSWDNVPGKLYTLHLYNADTNKDYFLETGGKLIVEYRPPDVPGLYIFEVLEQDRGKEKLISEIPFEVASAKEWKGALTPTDRQKKFCNCVLGVEARGSADNPYAVCAHSVGTTYRWCTENYYDFDTMSEDQLVSYAELHSLDTSGTIEQLRERIKRYISKKK